MLFRSIKVCIMIGGVVWSVAGRGSRHKDMKEKVSVVGSWGKGVVQKLMICEAKAGDPKM